MKPVYKCDYCSKMGTEEEIREHEPNCVNNYDMRSCYSCKHRGKITAENHLIKYECEAGKDVPVGKIFQFCDLYEKREIPSDLFNGLFGDVFGLF